jgi:hypothetical protein
MESKRFYQLEILMDEENGLDLGEMGQMKLRSIHKRFNHI